ncbi:hypothetical protein MCOR11_003304 [Pyricularia oryzae]|uniref:Uncharacterized protein n=2 Tax=Pyricularia TaxID=48558 RepID=A0ABQ8P3K6_PYRGI|nr:hypothetical protein MCOR26_000502 [Pyricularia oryzae]KAI6304807.1 hypothetical protein MCOR33_000320 [Pyricularia grisea]KAI6417544.1 hypothetical protein MCOR20_000382 [Pyricularia oryzae]KAI6499532.1 hypothetical protein MCOR11_003304 [Pyricularia oryzae]QBZ58087.1 hypothetical protein PoMZ_03026 [Pyricularia oryzae]
MAYTAAARSRERGAPTHVMIRPQTRNRKKRGREASESTEESDAILRRKINNDGISLRRTKLTPARRRRRSARPNARRRPATEWDDPNLNPGWEDLRAPSSESESEPESFYGEKEDEEYEEVSGLGPWTASRSSRGRSLVQSTRQPVDRTRRRYQEPGSLQVRDGYSTSSGLRGGTNSEPPEGDSSSTASTPSTSKEDKLKQNIARIENWVKLLGDREENWRRVEAGAMHHLAVTIEAWHCQNPTVGVACMRTLPHNTPTCSRLLPWIVGSMEKKKTAGKELKLVQDELTRAQHHAGTLRREAESARGEAASPETAEAERYADWAYQQTLRGDVGSASTQPYEGTVCNPDSKGINVVDLDANPSKDEDEQSQALASPVEIVNLTGSSDNSVQPRAFDSQRTLKPTPIDTDETPQPPPRRTAPFDQRWNPSRDTIRFGPQRDPSPPPVRHNQRQDLFKFPGTTRPEKQRNPFVGTTRSGQRRNQSTATNRPDMRWDPSTQTINFEPRRNPSPPAAGSDQEYNPFSAGVNTGRRRDQRRGSVLPPSRPIPRPVEINSPVVNVFDAPASNVSQIERERALRRQQDSNRRKRKREGDRRSGGASTEGAYAQRDGGSKPPDDAGTDPKRRKLEEDLAAYKARELKKIDEEGAAWEAGVLNWIAVKARHLFE